MVIAHSIEQWLPLTQNWVFNQLHYINSIQFIVLTYDVENLDLFPFPNIYQADPYSRFFFKAGRKLGIERQILPPIYNVGIRTQQATICHSHFGNRGWYDLILTTKHKLKHIVTFYGFDVNMLPVKHPVWKKRYQELFARADLFLCEGPFMAKNLIHLGCPNAKVEVQRLGIEVDEIPYLPRTLDNTQELRILIAGTFREKKGIPYALEAIGILKDQFPGLTATVIGDSTKEKRSKREKQKIHEVIQQYSLQSAVRFMGFQPHSALMAEAYKHHIFLSPSVTASDGDTEGGAPVTIIEMLASGMPVVSTQHCDIPEIIGHKNSGLLAEERNVEELTEHLKWLIENPSQWSEMTRKGREHVEKNFNVHVQANKLKNIYYQIGT